MTKKFHHQIIGPLIIGWLLLTGVSLAVKVVVWNRLQINLQHSAQATRLGESLSKLFGTLRDGEAGQRTYLLTGNEAYLEPFRQSEEALPADFDEVASVVGNDRVLQDNLMKLRGLAAVKMAGLRDEIKVRREKSAKEALALVNANKGTATMEEIRQVVGEMREQRQDLLSEASQKAQKNLELAQTFGVFTGILAVGAGMMALYLVRVGYLQQRARGQLLEEKLCAEKVVLEKSAFLANMSHEIRTPMNAILGFSELLDHESLTPRQHQYIRSIRASGNSLLQLINDVLDLSKIEAGKMELHLEPTDLREMNAFLQTMFGQQAMAKSLKLEFVANEVPQALLLDRLRMRQVLVNLVGNALKFTPQGTISVRFFWQPNENDRSRGTLTAEVTDTGVGISPLKQVEIFKPFVQSVPERNYEQQGSGLGLSIVQRLAQIMGGEIDLQSTVGKGSTFRLILNDVSVSARLPVSDDAEIVEKIDFNDFVGSSFLVVDDNPTNRELLTGLFERTHHQLRLASNGQEALKAIAESRPDIVLMDVRMPVMDGREAITAIRKTPGLELLPVIAITASSHVGDEETLRKQFSGYVQKPFSRKKLYHELAQFLRRQTKILPGTPPSPAPAPAETGAGATKPKALMATARSLTSDEAFATELRFLQETQWPRLRDSLAIRDTLAFARKLHDLGQQMQCSPLTRYAEQLTAHAETYSVRDLEKRLIEFPALVSSLEKR